MSQQKTVSIAEVLSTHFLKELKPHAPAIQRGLEQLDDFRKRFNNAAEQFVRQHEATFIALSKVDWADAARRVNAMHDLSKKAMILASSKGWFFGWNDSLSGVLTLVEKLDGIDSKELDEVMAQYHRENLDFVEKELTQRHPNRSAPITAAFAAHRNFGEAGYFLSIPVFIAQADGLLSEILDVKSPMSINKKGQREARGATALRAMVGTDAKLTGLLHPLLIMDQLDFLKSEADRDKAAEAAGKAFTVLNRHQVLHGECCDYGSEINSLKAFSFLAFVGVHLPMLLEDQKNIKP
ncbi:hypothetical protein ACXX82_00975 [Glaciimonas sp. GNP009]